MKELNSGDKVILMGTGKEETTIDIALKSLGKGGYVLLEDGNIALVVWNEDSFCWIEVEKYEFTSYRNDNGEIQSVE